MRKLVAGSLTKVVKSFNTALTALDANRETSVMDAGRPAAMQAAVFTTCMSTIDLPTPMRYGLPVVMSNGVSSTIMPSSMSPSCLDG